MSVTAENVRQEITKLVPASVLNEISCFVFYEVHPRDQHLVDIAICTKSGELKEFYKRDLVASLLLSIPTPSEIVIFRNDNADPFYLVFGEDHLLIISKGESLKIHKRIKNVNKYEIEDAICDGRASLKVFLKDDAVPLLFDDNFEIVEEVHNENVIDTAPIVTELLRKFTEAKYSVKCNEQMYEKLVKFRQEAMFSKYQIYKTDGNLSTNGLAEIASVLKIETKAPWVKLCNGKVVIIFEMRNQDEESLEDIQVLLHGTTRPAITYTTKLFEKKSISPFYEESDTHSLQPNSTIVVTVVVDLNELKCNVLSKIIFEAVVMFKKKEKEFLLPIERINISSLDTLKEDFDVLHDKCIDDPNIILAILATTEKRDLHLRHIKRDGENDIGIMELFCNYLNMELVTNTNNVVLHRHSSYHILNGVMIVVQDIESHDSFNISVFTRFPSQVLSLIHFIHDTVPAKLLITTPNYKIKAINDELLPYDENIPTKDLNLNYAEYATSILRRTSMLLEYLDRMMIKMNSSKNTAVQSKIGKEIQLFADGIENYVEFRQEMLKEADKGATDLLKCHKFLGEDSEPMIID